MSNIRIALIDSGISVKTPLLGSGEKGHSESGEKGHFSAG